MLVSNIKMSIENMNCYVQRRAVVLPGDTITEVKENVSIDEQLESIESHIEDLEVVRNRVCNAVKAENYLNPMLTEHTGP